MRCVDSIFWQSLERQNEGKSLFDIANNAWEFDPVLLMLGAAGVIYFTM
jgi:hypothetical protein